jgi:hypothetical protein
MKYHNAAQTATATKKIPSNPLSRRCRLKPTIDFSSKELCAVVCEMPVSGFRKLSGRHSPDEGSM